jgi:hypothetical protein
MKSGREDLGFRRIFLLRDNDCEDSRAEADDALPRYGCNWTNCGGETDRFD